MVVRLFVKMFVYFFVSACECVRSKLVVPISHIPRSSRSRTDFFSVDSKPLLEDLSRLPMTSAICVLTVFSTLTSVELTLFSNVDIIEIIAVVARVEAPSDN